MELVEGGQIITSEISTLHTPGHTPGHQCILIDSQGQQGVVVGDVIHMSVQIEDSDWLAGVDLDKPTGQKSREDLLDQSEREGLRCRSLQSERAFRTGGALGGPTLLAGNLALPSLRYRDIHE